MGERLRRIGDAKVTGQRTRMPDAGTSGAANFFHERTGGKRNRCKGRTRGSECGVNQAQRIKPRLGFPEKFRFVPIYLMHHLSSFRALCSLALVLICVASLAPSARAVTVTVGQTATLSVTADGTAPFSYQWYKNGTAMAGATAQNLVLGGVQLVSAGVYTVKVSNGAGSTVSAGASLVVQALAVAPLILTQPASRTVNAGSSATFSVVASGTPAPTYQWRKNGVAISGATTASYTIASTTTSHAGQYSVVVANSAGTVTSGNAVLTVNTAPVITTQPAGQTVIAGASVTLTVTATGSPAPTYQWRKNGTAITGATGNSYVFTGVTTAQAGTYSVVVTNSAGTVTSGNAVLAVNPPLPRHADFNGDGKSDILWQNILTGDHRLWLMAGTSLASTVTLGKMSTDWEIIGLSDFNGDGQNDILWQNLVTRESALWFMVGTTVAGGVSLGVAPSGMLIVGTGDFNADGMPDILWQNVGTGAYSIRFMNRTTPGASTVIGTGPSGWTVVGTGDFNGDRKPDILWQRISDGAARVWLMNGSAYASATDLGAMGAGWTLGGTGDFNGDGKTDILWQNTATGARKIALMSGLTKTGEVSLGTVAVEWIMVN
ncbi:hypothetical protein DF3PB_1010003 [uncultured Defluviicoccus sp.]|uniref:Ig-like domain-containing protein n=1 Tax=metagenome TaxID=256318 RepID=A0A380T7R4_9ZZZZ|nr:hypothetical protein DF3PB_1010003 [uncultured Defluviicoccus sp.]